MLRDLRKRWKRRAGLALQQRGRFILILLAAILVGGLLGGLEGWLESL